jgi:hypothetical protein
MQSSHWAAGCSEASDPNKPYPRNCRAVPGHPATPRTATARPARLSQQPASPPRRGPRDRDGPADRRHGHSSADVLRLHLDEPSQAPQRPAAYVAAMAGMTPK